MDSEFISLVNDVGKLQLARPTYHALFSVFYGVLAILRLFYHCKAKSWKRGQLEVGIQQFWFLTAFNLLSLTGVSIYIFKPEWMLWSTVSLPPVLRMGGVLLCCISVGLLVRIHFVLADNFSPAL